MSSKLIVSTTGFMSTKGIDYYVFLDNENFMTTFMLQAQTQFLAVIIIQCLRVASKLIS